MALPHVLDQPGELGVVVGADGCARRAPRRCKSDRTVPPRTSGEAERSLLDAIAEGEVDDHLGAIAAAVDARRRLLHTIDSSRALATLCVGDRGRIGQCVSPKVYLARLDGTVVAIDLRAATIQLDFPVGRFESGRVRCPPLAFEKP